MTAVQILGIVAYIGLLILLINNIWHYDDDEDD